MSSWELGSIFKLLFVVEHLTVGHLGPGSLWGREVTANGLNTQASTPSQTGGGQSRSQPRESWLWLWLVMSGGTKTDSSAISH